MSSSVELHVPLIVSIFAVVAHPEQANRENLRKIVKLFLRMRCQLQKSFARAFVVCRRIDLCRRRRPWSSFVWVMQLSISRFKDVSNQSRTQAAVSDVSNPVQIFSVDM
jgi:hypothetical protein